jgi:hypothetical protein
MCDRMQSKTIFVIVLWAGTLLVELGACHSAIGQDGELARPNVRDPGTDFSDYPNSAEVVPVGEFYLSTDHFVVGSVSNTNR